MLQTTVWKTLKIWATIRITKSHQYEKLQQNFKSNAHRDAAAGFLGGLSPYSIRAGEGRIHDALIVVVHSQDHCRPGGEHRLDHSRSDRLRQAPPDLREVPQGRAYIG